MQMEVPENVRFIIDTLEDNGHTAYIVGGAVRDSIIGQTPKDYDICTDAIPSDIISTFVKTIPTGVKHGTVTVVIDGLHYEVTTYRIDGKYGDGRRPNNVEFTDDIVEDLSRRDFTINAMAYHPDRGLVDPFNGCKDIEDKIIRCVGNPYKRFSEDYLRMLRFVRFAKRFKFQGNTEDIAVIKRMAPMIQYISKERIRDEFVKLLHYGVWDTISTLKVLKLINYILPEFSMTNSYNQHNSNHVHTLDWHIQLTAHYIEANFKETRHYLELLLAALYHDVGKIEAQSFDDDGEAHYYKHPIISERLTRESLKRLKFDNKTIDGICLLVKNHNSMPSPTRSSVKRYLNRMGDYAFQGFALSMADIHAHGVDKSEDRLKDLREVIDIAYDIVHNSDEAIAVKDLNISGYDIIQLGFKQGKKIGIILDSCLDYVLENPDDNNKETLVAYVIEHFKED